MCIFSLPVLTSWCDDIGRRIDVVAGTDLLLANFAAAATGPARRASACGEANFSQFAWLRKCRSGQLPSI
jgi:hypothetical protein